MKKVDRFGPNSGLDWVLAKHRSIRLWEHPPRRAQILDTPHVAILFELEWTNLAHGTSMGGEDFCGSIMPINPRDGAYGPTILEDPKGYNSDQIWHDNLCGIYAGFLNWSAISRTWWCKAMEDWNCTAVAKGTVCALF